MRFEFRNRKERPQVISFSWILKHIDDNIINIPEKQLAKLYSLFNTSPLFKTKNIFKKQLSNFFYRILPQQHYITEEEEEDE